MLFYSTIHSNQSNIQSILQSTVILMLKFIPTYHHAEKARLQQLDWQPAAG